MSKETDLLTNRRTAIKLQPDQDGYLPSMDEMIELMSLMGEDADEAYLNAGQLEADRSTAIKRSTLRKSTKRVGQRLREERNRLDRVVAQMESTDPRDRDANPHLTPQQNQALQRKKAEAEANIQALEAARDALRLSTTDLIKSEMDNQQLSTRAATLAQEGIKPEVARLLASMNMNLDLSLNGRQTEVLMSALLTCNENQLSAVYSNKKVPIVVKIMAKRLLDDLKVGSTEKVEMLWDRMFGKGILDINGQAATYRRQLSAAAQKSQANNQINVNLNATDPTGQPLPRSNGRQLRGEDANRLLHDAAMPEQPLSREAYIMIREHFLPQQPTAAQSPSQAQSGQDRSPADDPTIEEAEYVEDASDAADAANTDLEGLL